MTRQPRRSHAMAQQPADLHRSPIATMWGQVRSAIGEAVIPVLAGFKTLWLMLFAARNFFRASLLAERPPASLRTPFDLFWITVSNEPRRPLEPAQLLLFALLFHVLLQQELNVGMAIGAEAAVNAALAEAGVTLSQVETAELARAVEAGVETGVQVAGVEQVAETLATQPDEPEIQAAAQSLEFNTLIQPDVIRDTVDAAVQSGVNTAQDLVATGVLSARELQSVLESGVATGIQTTIELNEAWARSTNLLQLAVNATLNLLPPALLERVAVVQIYYEEFVAPLLDQALIGAIVDLIGYLLVAVIFATLFRLIIRRGISAPQSYAFWLYMQALALFSTAIFLLCFHLFPEIVITVQQGLAAGIERVLTVPGVVNLLAVFGGGEQALAADVIAFWLLESGLHTFLWLYVAPSLILPRIFPGMTAGRVFFSALLGRTLYFVLVGLAIVGIIAGIAAFGIALP